MVPKMIVPEFAKVRFPVPLVIVSVEAALFWPFSPAMNVPALAIVSLPFPNAKLVVPWVARRARCAFVMVLLPFENELAPEVCQESALVLLKVEADAPERSTLPL